LYSGVTRTNASNVSTSCDHDRVEGCWVLAERGWCWLGEQRQAGIGEVDQPEVQGRDRVSAYPLGDGPGLTTRTGAARDDADPQPRCLIFAALFSSHGKNHKSST
jgi:hypothetical protein